MKKILTVTLAVAIAVAPASAIAQGRITGQQPDVTGSKPEAEPGKYEVVDIKKAKAVHHKRKHWYGVAKAPPGKYKVVDIKNAKPVHHKHSYRISKAPHYAEPSYDRPGHDDHHWHGHHPWLLPALVGAAIGFGLFRF